MPTYGLFSLRLPHQYYSTNHTSTDLYSHTLATQGPSPKVPFFQSCANITYVNLAMHAPESFFDIQHLNALITFESNLLPL